MARRRSPVRKRTRRRRSQSTWPLAVVGIILLFVLAPKAGDILASSWPLLLIGATALAGLLVIAALLIRRLGDDYRAEALRRAGIDRLTPGQFEHLTAELLRNDGFTRVRVVGGRSDRGVDVIGIAPGGTPYAIQCKLYTRQVGPGQVRDFIGALQAPAYRGHRGVLVTSHVLSGQAGHAAREAGFIVVDRDRLGDWMMGVYSLTPAKRSRPAFLDRLRRGYATHRGSRLPPENDLGPA